MNLYLVALLPPEPIRREVWALKQEVHQRTGSRNAINLPAHITLVPPLRQPPAFEAAAVAALRAFAATQSACLIGLENFAWFQRRTLYVHVSRPAAVQALHQALYAWCATQLPAVPAPTRPFVPHVTLATRDLPPDMTAALYEEFRQRTYAASASWHELVLFRHDGRKWQPLETLHLPPVTATPE